jgi:AcrR family transcriptional regulator
MLSRVERPAAQKRPYDARVRQARASAERAETRRKVVEAAFRLFSQRGYVATTVADIAREAGVALQSVYKAGHSKAELLHLASDLSVAGDQASITMSTRPALADIIEDADPRRKLARFAELHSRIMDRALPLIAAEREAAAVDPAAAAELAAHQDRRLETYRHLAASIPAAARHPGMTVAAATDALWTVASPEVALLLRRTRGWTRAQHQAWLATTLPRLLLAPRSLRKA